MRIQGEATLLDNEPGLLLGQQGNEIGALVLLLLMKIRLIMASENPLLIWDEMETFYWFKFNGTDNRTCTCKAQYRCFDGDNAWNGKFTYICH